VLGDRPFPKKDLSHGFIIPLSKSLALEAKPRAGETVLRSSEIATAAEVAASNTQQVAMAEKIVIGPDRAALKQL
jgi:hypothetical protein